MSRARTRSALLASLVAFVSCAALVLHVPSARAGDRRLEVLLVNMAPASAGPDCMRDVTRIVRRDQTNIHRIGGDRVRELAGHRDDGLALSRWRAEDLDAAVRVVRTDRPIDAVVLIDCRAEEGRVEAWVRSPNRAVSRLVLRRTVIDTERAEWIARTLLLEAWIGFTP